MKSRQDIQRFEVLIGQLLRAGLFISFILVLIGGSFYLVQNGSHLINYTDFHENPYSHISVISIWRTAFTFSAQGLILLGLLSLIFTQVLRVALTAWLFIRMQDLLFTGISLVILAILIYSLFWH